MDRIPVLIAHRGWPARYPENSAEGIRAALEAGACFVEFDVQMSGDGVPVVIHDDNLRRTGGVEMSVLDTPLERLRQTCIGEAARLGGRFPDARVSALAEVLALLAERPRAGAFVEIKRASLRRFGIEPVVERVMSALRPVLAQCVVISFNRDAVAAARKMGAARCGWALESWDDAHRDTAARLAPDFLFCKLARFPAAPTPLWDGSWRWAGYQTDDPEVALAFAARGVGLVETDDIGAMLRHPALERRSCAHD